MKRLLSNINEVACGHFPIFVELCLIKLYKKYYWIDESTSTVTSAGQPPARPCTEIIGRDTLDQNIICLTIANLVNKMIQ